MSLNSFAFLLGFFPVVAIVVHMLRDWQTPRRAQWAVLAASLVFFARDNLNYLPLLIGSITFNWWIARLIVSSARDSSARLWGLRVGLSANVLLLCVFKYAAMVVPSLGGLLGTSNVAPVWAFPLGVSFFTLTQVMYLVDVYEGLIVPSSWFDHATFVSFFPNITAGPLTRAKRFLSQLDQLGGMVDRDTRILRGLVQIAIGLFKKVVLAESVAFFANAGYAHVGHLSGVEAWCTALAYTFQMYFDFSGYSDMAFGAARVLGIDIARNFNAPFRASHISMFWQRWHISLSTFITTYLYTPMLRGMGQITLHKSAVATLVAMLIAGVWHGATWPFFMFYVIHGLGLVFYQYWKRFKRPLPSGLDVAATFLFAVVAFVVFRAPDLTSAATMLAAMVVPDHWIGVGTFTRDIARADLQAIIAPALLACIVAFVGPTSNDYADRISLSVPSVLTVAMLSATAFVYLSSSGGGGFIYRAF